MNLRSALIKSIYRTQLEYYSTDTVKAFWNDYPLNVVNNHALPFHEFFPFIWKGNHHIPSAWFQSVLSAVEKFVVSNGDSSEEFAYKVCHNSGTWCIADAVDVVPIITPYLHIAIQTNDIHDLLLKLIGRMHAQNSFRIVATHDREDGLCERFLALTYTRDNESVPLAMNFDLWGTTIIKHIPQSIRVEPFESVTTLGDCRNPEALCAGVGYDFQVGPDTTTVTINHVWHGEWMPFSAFLGMFNVSSPLLENDPLVFVPHDDIPLPDYSETLLYKNRAYASPFYIVRATYQKRNGIPRRFLCGLVQSALQPVKDTEALRRHTRLLQSLQPADVCLVRYYREQEKAFVNNKYFAKGMSAKILRTVLSAYIFQKKSAFEYEDLKICPGLFRDLKRPAIEVYLSRLEHRFKQNFPAMKLVRHGKGKFEFACEGTVRLVEE